MTLSQPISKRRRSNLAAVIALVIVAALASTPGLVSILDGRFLPTVASVQHLDADGGPAVAAGNTMAAAANAG